MTSELLPSGLLFGDLAMALGLRALPYLDRSLGALGASLAGNAGWRSLWGAQAKPRAFAIRKQALEDRNENARTRELFKWETLISEPLLEYRSDSNIPEGSQLRILLADRELAGRALVNDPLAQVLEAAWKAACFPQQPPRLMGIVNVTPDSFSDGGRFLEPAAAIAHGLELEAQGAEFLDIGGESTRPGAQPVSAETELERVLPVIRGLAKQSRAVLSIDTTKATVARAALDAGATLVNDISAGLADPEMLSTVAPTKAIFAVMHRQGDPQTMQANPMYLDPVAEVCEHLRERLAACVAAGISAERIWLDPGIGFGKRLPHNLALLRRLPELRSLGCPLLLGVSRKSFIGHLTGAEEEQDWQSPSSPRSSAPPSDRVAGTAAALSACVAGGADILRVHDVAAMAEAAAVAYSLVRPIPI